jgi:hypothetical protein
MPRIIAELGMATHIVAVVNPGRSGLRECAPFYFYWPRTVADPLISQIRMAVTVKITLFWM